MVDSTGTQGSPGEGPADLAIDGATVYASTGPRRVSLYVRDGRIAALAGPDRPAAGRLDATGMLVLPGFVDCHVHLMEPADPSREDWAHGTAAAASSGVTTIVEHTHAAPVRDRRDLEAKVEWLVGRSHVDYALAAHAWPDRIDRLAELWRGGAAFVKVFTCTTHGVPGFVGEPLRDLMEAVATVGMPCLVHAEDEEIVAAAETALRNAGRSDSALLPIWRSRRAEAVAVARVLELAGSAGAAVVIAHASHVAILELVADARSRGVDAVAESCPQYLSLRETEVNRLGGLRKFTPPARARSGGDLDSMWRAVADGRVHYLSSDHAPATLDQKADGSIWDVHFGLPGLDTTSAILLDAALSGRLPMERVVDAYASAPAARFGLAGKGRIEPGADADLAILDPSTTRVLSGTTVRSKAGWTPFEGREVRGQIVTTLLRGRPIFEAGRVTEPRGRFVPGAGLDGSSGLALDAPA